jgi:BirA family biotin operon repressor/biotin-[acetyl-CoA-carboxylase] ligase
MAVAEAIKELGTLPVQLKWPNDVLIGDKKVAGILGEMIAEVDVMRFVILGVGINVNVEKGAFPQEIKDIATALNLEVGHKVSRSDFLCHVLERFEYYYDLLLSRGVEPILQAWRSLPNILGSTVTAETPEGVLEGKALDIDHQGALLVQTVSGEMKRIMAGDVCLVRPKGKIGAFNM